MNVITLLKKDHQKVKALLTEATESSPRAKKKREKLFSQIKNELQIHTKIEENFLYPLLKDHKLTRDMAFEAYEEHDVVDYLLAGIEKESSSSPEWTAKLAVLKESVEHHIKEEEKDIFIKMKKFLHEDELVSIAEQMQEFKERMAS